MENRKTSHEITIKIRDGQVVDFSCILLDAAEEDEESAMCA